MDGHFTTQISPRRHGSRHNSSSQMRVLRLAGAVILCTHGLIHAMGTVLLWRIAEPGTLRYSDAVPDAGSTLGYFGGALWAVAGIGFCIAAVQLATRRSALVTTVSSALLSAVMISLMFANAPVGFFVSLAILAVCVAIAFRAR
jgi:hypothetical protein